MDSKKKMDEQKAMDPVITPADCEDAIVAIRKKDTPQESDIRLVVDRILAGEHELFDIIMTGYRTHVFNMAWKMTNNYEDSLDVTQMVFVRAFQALDSWRGKAKFSTWLYRIAMNTSIDYIRKFSKHEKNRMHELEDEDNSKAFETILEGISKDNPRRNLELIELQQRLYKAVMQLGGMQKKCFVLRHYHDHAIKEIADILDCSEGTVKRHLHRAGQKLKTLLF